MTVDFEPIRINAELIADWSERLAYMKVDQFYLNSRIQLLERKIDAASYLLRTMAEDAAEKLISDGQGLSDK